MAMTIAVSTTRDHNGTIHVGFELPLDLGRMESRLIADLKAGKDVTFCAIPPDANRGFPWWRE